MKQQFEDYGKGVYLGSDEDMAHSKFDANSFYFAIGTLAHNLFLLFKQILDESLQHHTIKTIRYKLYHIAGKVVKHAREITLKVNEQFVELLQNIRVKAYEMSLE